MLTLSLWRLHADGPAMAEQPQLYRRMHRLPSYVSSACNIMQLHGKLLCRRFLLGGKPRSRTTWGGQACMPG